MIRQTLRPVARASRTALQNARSYSQQTSPPKSGNPLIVPAGLAAIVLGGAAYFYVPLKHDLADRSQDAEKNVAKPSTLKALATQPDVRKSVLDQDSLKESIHKREPSSDKASKVPDTIEKKAEEASQPAQTAFNEETGEINWDCPCLGGMADGPCGEQFKAAFSCFIYSEEEPKGVDCVEKFKHMQDCFREHPEVYGEEIDDDEEDTSASSSAPKSDDWKPDSQKNRKIQPPNATPPANSPVHSATQENSVKSNPKIVPTEKRIDKGPGGMSPPIGEGTVPKPFGGDSPREGK